MAQMGSKPKKGPREKDLTSRYLSGGLDEDRVDAQERFKPRNKLLAQEKIVRTAAVRAGEESGDDIQTLPIGQVIQIYSRYCEVDYQGTTFLCVVRKTVRQISETQLVVGDRVRFRPVEGDKPSEHGQHSDGSRKKDSPEAVVELALPRETVLTRADSFKGVEQHPIVANAQQMLIVASLREPRVKWGLIDRMLVAALSGGLRPIICLNKVDLVTAAAVNPAEPNNANPDLDEAEAVLAHYQSMGYEILRTSVPVEIGLDHVRSLLAGRETVVAGHSGVGKSTLLNAIQPALQLRVGDVSRYTAKGRHTTTSARRYPLDTGGAVIDTPGVKLFGLWGVTPENLPDFFPDVENGTAPEWRRTSYERILASLNG